MIILISGTTHTGKTALSQRLMEKYKIPYLSVDHLKMGLIRSGNTSLTVNDDEKLTPYLWSIVREIIKTAIENRQNMIIEGCYIPFDWQKDFEEVYLREIKFYCLVMTAAYIENNIFNIDEKEVTAILPEIKADGVVLGCTHYAFVKEIIAKKYGCPVYDGIGGTSARLCRILGISDHQPLETAKLPAKTAFIGGDEDKNARIFKLLCERRGGAI